MLTLQHQCPEPQKAGDCLGVEGDVESIHQSTSEGAYQIQWSCPQSELIHGPNVVECRPRSTATIVIGGHWPTTTGSNGISNYSEVLMVTLALTKEPRDDPYSVVEFAFAVTRRWT